MGLIQSLEDKAKRWVLGVGLKKAAMTVAQMAVSLLAAHHAPEHAAAFGVSVSLDPEVVAGGILGVLKLGLDFLGHHVPALSWMAPSHTDAKLEQAADR